MADIIEAYKAKACQSCPISLVCWSRHIPAEYYWCKKCQGWWLPDQDTIVCCDGYTLNDMQVIESATNSHISKAMMRTTHSIGNCPHCRNYTEKFKLVQGYVIEDTR